MATRCDLLSQSVHQVEIEYRTQPSPVRRETCFVLAVCRSPQRKELFVEDKKKKDERGRGQMLLKPLGRLGGD